VTHELRHNTLLYFFRLVAEFLQPEIHVSAQVQLITRTQSWCFQVGIGC
jgi:hypothetical protein